MTTTDGSTRTGDGSAPTGREPRTARRIAAGLAGLALGVSAVAACTGGSPAPAAGNGTVTVTSTTDAPSSPAAGTPSTAAGTPSTTGSPASPTSPTSTGGAATSPASSAPVSATSSSGGAEAPSAPVAGSLTACAPGQMRVTVMGVPGGGSAGHQEMQVIATNTGRTPCTLQGYPGVSLTAPGSGAQLGAAADRVPGDAPLMRLEPGKTAVASLQVAQTGVYGGSCGETPAAGFRIYLPGQTAAIFAPFPTSACRTASVHQLSVKPFTV